jgi:hypothetical protein
MYMRATRAAIIAKTPQIKIGIGNDLVNGAFQTVAPNTTVTFSTTPTVAICITDMNIARSIGSFFVINEMKAARVSFLADGRPLICDGFAPDSVRPPMEWPSVAAGTPVTLTVTNFDAAAHPFIGEYICIPAPSPGPCLG